MRYCVIDKVAFIEDNNGSVGEFIPGQNGEPIEITNQGTMLKFINLKDVTFHEGFPMFSDVEVPRGCSDVERAALNFGVHWKTLHDWISKGEIHKLIQLKNYLGV